MTEIIMPVLADKFRNSKPSVRRDILLGLAERLSPLNKGAIGLMIDHNSLEGAFPTIRRVNQKALDEYLVKAKEYLAVNGHSYPLTFKAPFEHNPSHPEKEEAAWGSMLRNAINMHL